jgi:hypothetical protein
VDTEPILTRTGRRRPATVLPAIAATWSALTLVLGLWWWALPGAYPFVPGNADPSGTLLGIVPAAAVAPALVAAGAWGLVVAGPARRHPGLVVGTGAVFALLFGLAVPGVQPLSLTGYSMAMFGPIVLAAVIVAGAWRWRGGPAAVGVLLLVGGAAWVSGIADGDVLARYAVVVTTSLHKFGPPAALLFLLAGGLLWGVLAVRTATARRADGPAPA